MRQSQLGRAISAKDPGASMFSMLRRGTADRGRLNVELRFFGMVGFLWVCSIVLASCWAWSTVAHNADWAAIPWGTVLAPQVIALMVVMTALVIQLPRPRWRRRGSLVRLPSAWPLLLAGSPALLFTPLLYWRDAHARRHPSAPTPEAIEMAFHQLVRLPRTASLQFLVWVGLAYIGDAVILGVYFDWPRPVMLGVALLWLASLGPIAAIVASRGRAILRPEYLTAPRSSATAFQRNSHMAVKLGVNASIASMGAIAAPLAAGYLWMWSHGGQGRIAAAEQLGQRIVELAQNDRQQAFGRVLGRHPQITVHWGNRTHGPLQGPLPRHAGLHDLDRDGRVDTYIHRSGTVEAAIPLDLPSLVPLDLLVFGGIFCLGASVGAIVLLARDAQRDVVRASAQVEAVAHGAAPPPLTEGSFATGELRQLVLSVDRLVSRITETNVGKYVAIEKAKEADRLKSQFLANMSHDLRSPLNSILGFSELLLTGIDGELSPEHREMLELIHGSGRNLLQEIDDILDMAKIDAGRMDVHPEPTPPATLITRAIQNVRRRREASIEYETEIAPGLPPAFVDPLRTGQALENILLFAGKRLHDQALRITVRSSHGDQGRMIDVTIRTPEPPATSEQLSLAHQGFHRIPGHRGLGLGLPIANAILELQDGSLSVENHRDFTVFRIELPVPETRRPLRLRA